MNVYLFGSFHISTNTSPEVELRPTAARLLAFLLLHRDVSHPREVVANFFWEGAEIGRARRSLNTALWQLRNAFGQFGDLDDELIVATPEQIRINQKNPLRLDVALFEERAMEGLAHSEEDITPKNVRALQEAISLYQGDLLIGFYDDWAISERERLRMLYLRCLIRLMHYHQQAHDLDKSIEYAQQVLLIEPWREDIHRTLITLFTSMGRRGCAIEQYRICRKALEEELDVPPSPETEAIYQQLLLMDQPNLRATQAKHAVTLPRPGNDPKPTMAEATQQLQAALLAAQTAQAELQRAMSIVSQLA